MLELLLGAVLGYALDMWGEVLDRQDAITLGKETLRRAQLDRSRSPKDRMFRLATRAVEVLQERSPDLCKLHPKMISVLSDPVFIEKIFDAILSPPDSPSGCKARQEAHGVLLAASIADGSPETVSTTTADYLALLDEVVTADEGLSRLRSERTGSQVLWSLASIEADLSEVLDNARLVPEIKTIVQELSGREAASASDLATELQPRPLPQSNEFFAGRQHLIASLAQEFTAGALARVALTGPGGIGKTQVAVELLERLRKNSKDLFWIRATNFEQLATDLMGAAHALGSSISPTSDVNSVVREIERLAEKDTNCLFVFDGADDLQVLRGRVPTTNHVLITTRNAQPTLTNLELRVEEVGAFSEAEAEAFFAQRLPEKLLRDSELVDRRAVALALGGYPLALEQAAAYLEVRQGTFSNYLQRFNSLKLEVFSAQSAVHGRVPEELDAHDASKMSLDEWASVATTWRLNFQNLGKTNPLASKLLESLAFFAPDDLPHEVVVELFQLLSEAPKGDNDRVRLAHLLDSALADISRFSLARIDESKAVFQHEVLALALRAGLSDRDSLAPCEADLVALEAALPFAQQTDWRQVDRFIPHATALLSRPELAASTRTDLGAEILARIGSFFLELERYPAAAEIITRSLEIMTKLDPPMYERLISTTSNLGNAFRGMGALKDAHHAFEMAIELLNKVQPTEGVAHAIMYNQLGTLKAKMGDPSGALALQEKAVRLSRDGQSNEHLAIHAHNLGKQYEELGQIDDAERLYSESIDLLKQTGALPPTIANAISSLAHVHASRGEFKRALEMESEALRLHEEYWPPNHPAIARRVNDYANALFSLGRMDEAIDAAKRSLAIRQMALGIGHPEVAQARLNFGSMLVHVGRPKDAIPQIEVALEVFRQVLGYDDQETGEAQNALGHALIELGRTDEGVRHLEKALGIFDKLYPAGHRTAATILHNLGGAYHRLGQSRRGLAAFERCLSLSSRLMPDNHPHLCATYHNRGHMLLDLGRFDDAEQDLIKSLQIASLSNEADQVSPLIRLGELGIRKGQQAEGTRYLTRAAEIAKRVFPEGHRAFGEIRSVLNRFRPPTRRNQSDLGKPKKSKRRRKANVRYLPPRTE